jgi:parallel beta-helix repeat protein
MRIIFTLTGVLLLSAFSAPRPIEFYIAANGLPSNEGTKARPFSSLEDAKKAIQLLKRKNKNQLPKGGVIVWLRKGIYELPQTFELDDNISGTKNAPIVFSAYQGEKVVFSGGKKIEVSQVKIIGAEAAERIVEKTAIPHIRELDIKRLGITDYGTNQITGFRRPYVNAAMELFINGNPFHLARYPNKEKVLIKTEDVVDKGAKGDSLYPGKIRFDKAKLAQWKNAKSLTASGNFNYAWATDQLRVNNIDTAEGIISFSDAHMFGITGGNAWNQYYFFNLLEEIDQPGEYYIDHEKGKLYFYPLSEMKASDTITVSMLKDALVTLKGASHITFKNISFEAGRGNGIYMENTHFNKIENCTISNMGVVGVCIGMGSEPTKKYAHPDEVHPFYPDKKLSGRLGSLHELMYENTTFNREGGKNNGVINCKIINTGCGGISLGGGDRKTLVPAGNYVYNSEFTNCGRRDYSYKAPVNIDGVGNKVQQCQFNPCPATAIYMHGNNHVLEYNFINEACSFIEDQGAIYLGRDPSEFGNIIRYNFFKNIGATGFAGAKFAMAVYYDDGACGTQLYGNVFYKAGTRTVMILGGSYNAVFNNIFIESPMVFHLENSQATWAKAKVAPGGTFDIRLKAVNYKNPPYSKAYPVLTTYFEDHPEIPKHNDIQNNVFVNIGELNNGKKEWGPIHDNNLITKDDPGFVDASKSNFALKQNSIVFKKLPGFKPIPFSKIGLIKITKKK